MTKGKTRVLLSETTDAPTTSTTSLVCFHFEDHSHTVALRSLEELRAQQDGVKTVYVSKEEECVCALAHGRGIREISSLPNLVMDSPLIANAKLSPGLFHPESHKSSSAGKPSRVVSPLFDDQPADQGEREAREEHGESVKKHKTSSFSGLRAGISPHQKRRPTSAVVVTLAPGLAASAVRCRELLRFLRGEAAFDEARRTRFWFDDDDHAKEDAQEEEEAAAVEAEAEAEAEEEIRRDWRSWRSSRADRCDFSSIILETEEHDEDDNFLIFGGLASLRDHTTEMIDDLCLIRLITSLAVHSEVVHVAPRPSLHVLNARAR